MAASYNDPVVAIDELGREIRATRTGQRYLATDLTPTRPQATSGRGLGYNILDNIIGYDDGVDTPGERAGAAIGAIASDPIGAARGAVSGVGGLLQRLVGGTGTMGDVIDATGLLNVGSLAATAPSGALRAGAARNVDEYAGSHRAPSREYGASLDDPREMFGGDDIYSENAMRYFGHGDTAMDRESIRAINAARGNPDAEITVYRAVPSDLEGAVVNAGDWVTPSRKYAEMHGEGPLGGDYQIIEERVRAGDLFTDGDIHEWGYTPEPQTPAQRVAGLLSSGRADEVTDEMMAAADPQEMARLYASGATGMDLPMDEASRMVRAAGQGYDISRPMYHGTDTDFTSANTDMGSGERYRTGLYSSDNPDVAASYAPNRDGGMILPIFSRASNRGVVVDAQGANWNRIDASSPARYENSALAREFPELSGDENAYTYFGNMYDDLMGLRELSTNAMARQRRFEGDPSITFENLIDRGPYSLTNDQAISASQPSRVAVDFYPQYIRSRFARFDPRLSHLSNLNAANASPLLGGAVLAAPQEQPDPLRNLRGLLAR
jgi:hypothetical protein